MDCKEAQMLLDALVDGELSAEQEAELLAHVHACEACMEEYKAAMLLKDCLKDMDEEIAVPLEAQAAWRRAIHAEAKKKLSRKWMRVVSVAAAALVLVVGMGFVTKDRAPVQQPAPEVMELSVKAAAVPELIAADGDMQDAAAAAGVADNGYTARKKFTAADLQAAGEAVEMLSAEYSGSCTAEKEEASVLYRVELPYDYMEDFLSAVSRIGTELNSEIVESAGETAVILIQIDAE